MLIRPLALGLTAFALAACGSTAQTTTPTPAPSAPSQAEPTCDTLVVSIADGTLNGLEPTVTMAAAKKLLPCATGDTAEGSTFNCGGGVFYLGHDMFAYTHRDYFELRAKFPGTFDTSLLGESFEAVKATLGEPTKTIPSRDWTFHLYERPWGTLRVNVGADGTIGIVGLHATKVADTKLCL